jgi:hypothetical protein
LQSRKEIANSPKPDLELHYTEWSASYTPADPIHDSYHEAAMYCKIKTGWQLSAIDVVLLLPIFSKNRPHALLPPSWRFWDA